MTGAILHRELLAPTQKLRTFIVRGSYGLLLAATYGIIYLIYWLQTQAFGLSGTPHQAVSELAGWYVTAIVTINISACLVFTPAYVAGAIAQEKDQRTIQDLLLTTIGDWEIVLSKLVGRLAHAAFALLAGLPMFAIGAMLGGVSPSMMVALAAMTLIWLVSVGSFSLLISLLVRRTRDAVVGTYALGAMVLFGSYYATWLLPGMPLFLQDVLSAFNPLYVLQAAWTGGDVANVWQNIGWAAAVLGTFSALCLFLTVWRLRPIGVRQLEITAPRRRFRRDREALSPDDRPMLWKEKRFPPAGRITQLLRYFGLVAIVGMLGLLVWLYYQVSTTGLGTIGVSAWSWTWSLLHWPVVLSLLLTSSSAFSGERERVTWDAILASPLEASEIVGGKIWGSIWEIRWLLLAVALAMVQTLAVGLCTTSPLIPMPGVPPGSIWWNRVVAVLFVLGSAVEFVGAGLFLIGVGLRTSLVCRTSGRSLVITLGIYVGSGIVAGILLVLIFSVGSLLLFGWSGGFASSNPNAAMRVLSVIMTHWAWANPTISGLFWGGIGLFLIRMVLMEFDDLASRMRCRPVVSLSPKDAAAAVSGEAGETGRDGMISTVGLE